MNNNKAKLFFFLFIAMLIWGISWPNAKIIGSYADYDILIFWRFIFSTITILIIILFLKIPIILQKNIVKYIFLSSIFVVAYNYNYFKGTKIGLAGLGGVIVPTLSPIFTYLLSLITKKRGFNKLNLFGFLFGIIGGGILLEIWNISLNELVKSGNIYFIIAAITWSFVTIFSEKVQNKIHPLSYSFWIYCSSIILSLPLTKTNSLLTIFSFDWIFWVNFLIVSAFSVGFATTIFFYTTMRLGAATSSSFMYLVPVSALLFSNIMLGEKIMPSTIIGGASCIAAVYLINHKIRNKSI